MASADYISREAVVNAINSTPFTMSMFLNEDQCVGARQARDSLALIVKKSIPAADVRPVVRGKWIDMNTLTENYYPRYKCSLCGNCANHSNYCPNCGAMMLPEPPKEEN